MDIGAGFNDDPLWLIAAVSAYIRETGDFSILEEQVDFNNDHKLAEPLMEHLRRSYQYTLNHRGPHGLPLIGRADWNDCLNLNCFSRMPGESFQTSGPSEGPVAESVFIGGMFVKYANEYADLCDATHRANEAIEARRAAQEMRKAILGPGWDGAWFRRAYDAFGDPVGSKENVGIFCHNNPWVSCAETVVGHGDRAFEIYKKTCLAYIENISEIHRTEPYVYSQMVAGKDAPTHGEGKNSWLTGTAAWTFVNVSQYILGIQPTLKGLCIDPCIPHEMNGFELTRVFRGATYHITVDNTAHVEKGVRSVTVNGNQIQGNVLPLANAGEQVEVRVILGN